MRIGARIHRKIQDSMGSRYRAEVKLDRTVRCDRYDIFIEGRADGVIDPENDDDIYTVDEIKSTYGSVDDMEDAVPVHLAQAKCYACIYAEDNGLEEIAVTVTYAHIRKDKRASFSMKELRRFEKRYKTEELTKWFGGLIGEYRRWCDIRYDWKIERDASLKELKFPFPYRDGQRDLAAGVYRSLEREKILFLMAPTGTGKTISTLFPTLKAMGEGLTHRIFYLTAKTVTGTVAVDTLDMLRNGGLSFRYLNLVSKEKSCPFDGAVCTPESCEYAKGHFDRVNEALYEMASGRGTFSRESVGEISGKYRVCPYALSMDLSEWADCVICDYNYVFDPFARLEHFFTAGEKNRSTFLCDEAHNLVERARDMYSTYICKEDLLSAKAVLKGIDGVSRECFKAFDKVNKDLRELKKATDGDCLIIDDVGELSISVFILMETLKDVLSEHPSFDGSTEVLELYFALNRFMVIEELLDDKYVIYTHFSKNGKFYLTLLCVDPSGNLKECFDQAKNAVLFSATLLPVDYYKRLLCSSEDVYAVYAKSSFTYDSLFVGIATDVTSKYTRRGEDEYRRVSVYIKNMVEARAGNYIAFFPSYRVMNDVYEVFADYVPQDTEIVVQEPEMEPADREAFLGRFTETRDGGSLLGFCVMGGIFSEGIDLTNESLIGVAIYGTGLPMVNIRGDILSDYYEELYGNGFDYAYRFPGMNKVLQAAGRVIRTAEDKGVVLLLDERFLRNDMAALYPREWKHISRGNAAQLKDELADFWAGD
ncbi:MAG: ATP-dependent DNA helicase, partial [Eubacterium sp.]|nr:ATP-dependent DNA helicase [Eubacterium sp.]